MNGWTFTVTDLARFLGKSPVTIRGWDRAAEVDLPRDSGGDRKLTCEDVRVVAKFAYEKGRISKRRYQLVLSALYLLEEAELSK